jgi:hypothetical protein
LAEQTERPLTPSQQTDALQLKEVFAALKTDLKQLEGIACRHRYPTLRKMAAWAGVDFDRLEEELARL